MAFKDRLAMIAAERGVDQSELARRVRVSASAANQWFAGKTTPYGKRLDAIAEALGVTPAQLASDGPVPPLPNAILAIDAQPPPAIGAMPRDVPIFGTAQGGEEGAFVLNTLDGPIDWARRPYGLVGMKTVFAVYVEGTSMVPWRQPGDLVYLQRGRPPNIGDHVVVVLDRGVGEPPGAFIKQLARRTATRLDLVQYNPAKTISVDLTSVRDVVRVLEWAEVLGV